MYATTLNQTRTECFRLSSGAFPIDRYYGPKKAILIKVYSAQKAI